jgi:hypothetical protein
MNDIDEIREELAEQRQTMACISGTQKSLQSQFDSLSVRMNRVDIAEDRFKTLTSVLDTAEQRVGAVFAALELVPGPITQDAEIRNLRNSLGSINRDLGDLRSRWFHMQKLITVLTTRPTPWYRRLFR